MSIFTMPDGSAGSDGSTDWSALLGLTGVGDGYSYATTDSAPATSQTGQTLGDLQSGSINFDWTAAFGDTLGALVAVDSINHGLPTSATQGYYQGADGRVYATGTGPLYTGSSSGMSGLLMLGVLVFVVMELTKEHHG
jgi:hypothetical protein